MNKGLKITFDIVFTLIILLLVGYFVLRITGTVKIYKVETGSMEDKIHIGDYILLYRRDTYNVDDVVTYTVDNYFVTHRIVKIENDEITTKGDANNVEDAKIHQDQIIGKVIYYGGILNFIINYKYIIIAFIVGLYLLSCHFENDKVKQKK